MSVIPRKFGPFSGPKPPKGVSVGHIWHNTQNNLFYYKDENDKWIATDIADHVVDVIIEDDREAAYDRAMSIL